MQSSVGKLTGMRRKTEKEIQSRQDTDVAGRALRCMYTSCEKQAATARQRSNFHSHDLERRTSLVLFVSKQDAIEQKETNPSSDQEPQTGTALWSSSSSSFGGKRREAFEAEEVCTSEER